MKSRDPVIRAGAEARGRAAEARVAAMLAAEGFVCLGQRQRTPAGEIDLVVTRAGLLVFVEVKARATLAEAAFALAPRQQARLLAAAEAWMAEHPEEGRAGVRFDLIVMDAAGRMRRVVDAIRAA